MHLRNPKASSSWVQLTDMINVDSERERLVTFAKVLSPVFSQIELIPHHELERDKCNVLNKDCPLDGMTPSNKDEAAEEDSSWSMLKV